jgi:hypothetical protein
VTLRARWVILRARWVTLRARGVTLRSRGVMLRARWVTLRARGVTFRCALCWELYATAAEAVLTCRSARVTVSASGAVLAAHSPSRRWQLARYLQVRVCCYRLSATGDSAHRRIRGAEG